MLNSMQVNSHPLNAWTWRVVNASKYKISFNGYSLLSLCPWPNGWEINTSGVLLKSMNGYDVANIDLSTFISWLSNGGGIANRRYTKNTITMSLYITGESQEDLFDLIDNFKFKMSKLNWDLVFRMPDNTYRTAKATVTSLNIWNTKVNENFVDDVSITFEILDPFFKSEAIENTLYEWINADLKQFIDYKGTMDSYPMFIFTFNSSWNTDVSKIEIEIKQVWDTTGFKLDIQTTINNNDLLIFDWEKKTVTLNQVEIDYNWTFEPLLPWANFLDFNFTKTSVSCDIAVLYNNVYL